MDKESADSEGVRWELSKILLICVFNNAASSVCELEQSRWFGAFSLLFWAKTEIPDCNRTERFCPELRWDP